MRRILPCLNLFANLLFFGLALSSPAIAATADTDDRMQTVSATEKCGEGQLREDCVDAAVLKAKDKAAQFGADIVLIDGKPKAVPVAVKLRSIQSRDCPKDNGSVFCTVTIRVELIKIADVDLNKEQIAGDIAEFEEQIKQLQTRAETIQEQLHNAEPSNQKQNVALADQLTSLIAQQADLYATIKKLQTNGSLAKAATAAQQQSGFFQSKTAIRIGLAKAVELYQQALDHYDKGQYRDMVTVARQLVELREALLPPGDGLIADAYYSLSVGLYSSGYFPEAESTGHKSLSIRLAAYGENHPFTANSLNNLGNVYTVKGDYDQALAYYQRALKVQLQLLGENHPDTAATLVNLGDVYTHKNDLDQAITYYQRVLKVRLQMLGENHPSTANTLYWLGLIAREKQNYSQAAD
ncbi:MAG: tetratricopeptide repeat protein [Candidatus Pacebacteria bacterium]|nr:tetratricopeptide repeat protein [Candidatus Paceibacterota bacterium]